MSKLARLYLISKQRKMGRRKIKRSPKPSVKPTEPQLPAEDSNSIYDSYSDTQQDEILSLSRDVHDTLSKIYDEFFKDFEDRKDKRLKGNALGDVLKYSLVVQSSCQIEYRLKVRQIVESRLAEPCYCSFKGVVKDFVTQIRDSLRTVKDAYVRLMAFHDAFHVTLNVSDEVSKITSSLFRTEPHLSCEGLNLACLYDTACEGLEGTIQWAKSQVKLPNQIEKVMEIVNDLSMKRFDLICCTGPDYELTQCPEIHDRSYSPETIEDSPIWEPSIDELVEFIDPSCKKKSKPRRQKSQPSTASNSSSPNRFTFDGDEVEELKLRLADQQPALNKVKPNLKLSWLQSLKI